MNAVHDLKLCQKTGLQFGMAAGRTLGLLDEQALFACQAVELENMHGRIRVDEGLAHAHRRQGRQPEAGHRVALQHGQEFGGKA